MINRYGQVNWQPLAASGTLLKANNRSLGLCFQRNYHSNRSQSSSKSFTVINLSLLVLSCCAFAFTVNARVVGASNTQSSTKHAKAPANNGRRVAPSTSTDRSNTEAIAAAPNAPMADVIAIKEGADLDLSCPIVLQNEDMIISWTCENELANIRSSRIHVTETGKLRIRSAKLGDSCNYRCEAADGFATLSVIIKVIIVDKQMVDQIGHHNLTVPSTVSLQKQPASVNQSNQQHDLPSQTKLLKSNPQQKLAAAINPRGSHHGDHVTSGSFDRHQQPDELFKFDGQQQQQAELEIQIEPKSILVDKNQTFSLECRVKHAPSLIAPQMIWLKEFIGRKPDSVREAHEQNLVLIDNVYYHLLNWPRSITYSQNTASANSALLVRQSNFVHSGHYICFAGYPPSTMFSNLSFVAGSANSDYDQRKTTITTQIGSGKATFVRSAPSMGPLRYKMAIASVQVNDKEGEERHKQVLEAENDSREFSELNLLLRAVLKNSWKRNLTILLLILCSTVCVSKFVYIHCYSGQSSRKSQGRVGATNPEAANQHIVESTRSRSSTPTSNNLGRGYTPPQLAVKQIQSFPNYILLMPNTNGLDPIGNGSASYRRLGQPDSGESCLQELGDEGTAASTRLQQQETDHLYSEIGECFNITKPSQMLSTNNSGSDHQIYKTPNYNNNRNAS